MKAISSASNPRFKQWHKLTTQPRAVREQGLTLAEGEHLAQSALAAGVRPQAVLLRKGAAHEGFEPWLAQVDAPRFELSAALYDALCPVERGVGLMLLLPVMEARLPAVVGSDAMYLDGIQDPGNAGALLRVAAAAGVRHIWASAGTTALWAPKVLRGAQGAHFALEIVQPVSVQALREVDAIHWLGTAPSAPQSLWQARLPATALGWMFGAEGAGLSPEAQALCQQTVSIPISDAVESLNVATSAAVCLFERRRRMEQPAAG